MTVLAPRAPSRGRYDRHAPTIRRMLGQRARVLNAVALADWSEQRTIAQVTAIAGVGRSTVYEYFDDFAHAVRLVREEVTTLVRERLAPIEVAAGDAASLGALCTAWVLCVDEAPLLFLSALSHNDPLTPPTRALLVRVSEWARASRRGDTRSDTLSDEDLDGRVFFFAGAARCTALRFATARLEAETLSGEPVEQPSGDGHSEEAHSEQETRLAADDVRPSDVWGDRNRLTAFLARAAARLLAPE